MILAKHSIADVWQGSLNALGSVNIRNMPAFWIYQSPEYTRVLDMVLVLNILGFWMYKSFNYARVIIQGSEYAWIYLNNFRTYMIMPEYTRLCVNKAKCAWMAFLLHFPIVIPCLKKQETVFFKKKNLIISIAAKVFDLFFVICFFVFVFCFKYFY